MLQKNNAYYRGKENKYNGVQLFRGLYPVGQYQQHGGQKDILQVQKAFAWIQVEGIEKPAGGDGDVGQHL